ncbi:MULTISPECIES: superoxide dismutase family protein [unclassified Novosphingobium]|uniref:superoxide dismutase family protein n=1 Tax=unclassified Novosphingobium TaxID=2644732 RepID=UPI000D3249AB|nr:MULTISPECIES: superoxide dismutase family protein [unclassified Novosphingobium]PTR07822.1 Cu-Zn family superoxide dismutase [Novosphingobium sp. GV055]PUB00635.1 Cu-Zn family superoxide dismutase [Novosphingobium sp. GV061]PUB16044.1 Cu-Zn family superoxide dismutase [Novosphingobium sp. GV079]PUB39509.1 Cu-Zn family superoxide dismutase [Novosphingobium sp. GV027]
MPSPLLSSRLRRTVTTFAPRAIVALALPIALSACGDGSMAGMHSAPMPKAQVVANATLMLASGASAGTAELLQGPDGFRVHVDAKGLPPGVHGIHLHTVGKCDAPGFTTAGGHLNPDGHQHGAENPAGAHLGDLTNLTVGADGTGALDFALRGGADMTGPALFDADGTALVIHAAPDDYKTDPSGNSGARLACGVFVRQ